MKRFTMAAVLLGVLAAPVWGQDPEDEPGEGVARISVINGDVIVQRGDQGESMPAERNAPLVARDHVLTTDRARAEVQFDGANMIRIGPDSEVRLAELNENDYFIQLSLGTVTFRVLHESTATAEIGAPTVSVRPLRQGSYRITVRADGSAEVTVRSGEAEVFTPLGSEILQAGRTLATGSDPANPAPRVTVAILQDEWDRWNETRDRELERSVSRRYASRDIYGIEDLDLHGRWIYDPPYGWVWVPHVSSGWAPYRVGRWAWIDYYGWTWVSGEPWGWAPYHYGRWYHAPRHGWVWYPGSIGPRYYWKPALVAFFGWGSGSGVNVGFSFGNVGWVPLAPYEVYRPWYGRGSRNVVVNNVTVINEINVVNTYKNARFDGRLYGVTSVVARDFGRNRTTVDNYVRVADRDLGRAGDIRGGIPFEPRRDNREFVERSAPPRNASRAADRGPIVTRPDREATTRVTPPAATRPAPRREPIARSAPEPRREPIVRGAQPRENRQAPRVEAAPNRGGFDMAGGGNLSNSAPPRAAGAGGRGGANRPANPPSQGSQDQGGRVRPPAQRNRGDVQAAPAPARRPEAPAPGGIGRGNTSDGQGQGQFRGRGNAPQAPASPGRGGRGNAGRLRGGQ